MHGLEARGTPVRLAGRKLQLHKIAKGNRDVLAESQNTVSMKSKLICSSIFNELAPAVAVESGFKVGLETFEAPRARNMSHGLADCRPSSACMQ